MPTEHETQGAQGLQDRLLGILGSSVGGRMRIVADMLERNAHEAASYWLQLVVAIGIATLGLVVGSTAVIIGAMLIAPLMTPIVALAMGLATGSPFLVLRSASRIALSVLVAIGGAALITVLLPFHEINAEISARTSPTALDLLTAGFCALAGVYASLRAGSDTAATAAGTSIGISLVPPLCASGYGVGTASWPVASGAALLFLTNLVAIIFVGTGSFVAVGFNRVNPTSLERDQLAKNDAAFVTAAIARRLAVFFESKAGPLLRFLMPFVLLAAVYVPLRRALDEVAWQVRVRASIDATLGRERRQIVHSRVRVERHEVDVLLILVGKTADAEAARARLQADIKLASGVAPSVEVLAIPDAKAMAGLESSLRSARKPSTLPPPPASPVAQRESARTLLRSSVMRLFPSVASGEPLVIELDTNENGPLVVRIVHLGATLGPDAAESLGRGLGAALEGKVRIVDVPIPVEPMTRAEGDLAFAARVAGAVRETATITDVSVCVVRPPPQRQDERGDQRERELAEALGEVLAQHPRVAVETGVAWSVRFVRGPCPSVVRADAGGAGETPPK